MCPFGYAFWQPIFFTSASMDMPACGTSWKKRSISARTQMNSRYSCSEGCSANAHTNDSRGMLMEAPATECFEISVIFSALIFKCFIILFPVQEKVLWVIIRDPFFGGQKLLFWRSKKVVFGGFWRHCLFIIKIIYEE